MSSEAFVDNWTSFFANHFEVTSQYYYFIGIPGRNLFYNYLRAFVEGDRSYSEVVTELIATSGDSLEQGPLNFLVRGVQEGDPVQDTWDVLADRITSKFLGIRTECVSCHDGANHLEEINLYLSERRREEFWGLSAFLARTNLIQLPVDTFEEQSHFIIANRPTGVYTGVVDPNNPGPRPFRTSVAKTPVYMFTGETPGTGNWRSEVARMVVSDRQFARATVNYIWAHFFRAGIVDPPERLGPGANRSGQSSAGSVGASTHPPRADGGADRRVHPQQLQHSPHHSSDLGVTGLPAFPATIPENGSRSTNCSLPNTFRGG